MDVGHGIIAEWTGIVEVLSSITQGAPDTVLRGALDAAGLGAHRNDERIMTGTGVEMPRRL